jgi:uncharacterized membrane protein
MYSKIKLVGHPVHPMLVAYPIAMYTFTLVFLLVYMLQGDPFWFRVALVLNVVGVLMALLTAIPGFLDWLLGIPAGTRAKATGLTHMILNVLALVVFAVAALMNLGQWSAPKPEATLALVLALVGVLLTVGAGLFGWTLIQNHHVGVELTPDQARLEPDAQAATRTQREYRPS